VGAGEMDKVTWAQRRATKTPQSSSSILLNNWKAPPPELEFPHHPANHRSALSSLASPISYLTRSSSLFLLLHVI